MARKKKNIFQDARDIFAQGLISVRKLTGFFQTTNRDKRSIKSTQRAARELAAGHSDKEVASQLGISRQKWTALKHRIEKGAAYSPELREVLREADQDIKQAPPAIMRGEARGKEPAPAFYVPKENRDKRSIKSTQRAARQLAENRSDKEVASQLGMSRQKWTGLKKKIESGEAYSPELKDQLDNARLDYTATPQQMENGVYFFPDMGKLKKVTHVDIIKTFGFLDDALDWWESIVSSDTYIAITELNGSFHVVGLGRRNQRPYKGKVAKRGGGNRVKQLLDKYPKAGKR